jgi:hypothetical protein
MRSDQLRRTNALGRLANAGLLAAVVVIVIGSTAAGANATPSYHHHGETAHRLSRISVDETEVASRAPGRWLVEQARQQAVVVASARAAAQANARAIAQQQAAAVTATRVPLQPPAEGQPAAPPVPSRYGCAAALSYLQQHAAAGYQLECPGDAQGHQAATCFNVAPICPNGGKRIMIADPCPAAYMNEAYNSQVISAGNLTGPWDPYGWCGQFGNPNG